jgi:hypothetical protein
MHGRTRSVSSEVGGRTPDPAVSGGRAPLAHAGTCCDAWMRRERQSGILGKSAWDCSVPKKTDGRRRSYGVLVFRRRKLPGVWASVGDAKRKHPGGAPWPFAGPGALRRRPRWVLRCRHSVSRTRMERSSRCARCLRQTMASSIWLAWKIPCDILPRMGPRLGERVGGSQG